MCLCGKIIRCRSVKSFGHVYVHIYMHMHEQVCEYLNVGVHTSACMHKCMFTLVSVLPTSLYSLHMQLTATHLRL